MITNVPPRDEHVRLHHVGDVSVDVRKQLVDLVRSPRSSAPSQQAQLRNVSVRAFPILATMLALGSIY